jgi:hypothetical protein
MEKYFNVIAILCYFIGTVSHHCFLIISVSHSITPIFI